MILGKWLMTKESDTYVTPNIAIIEFNDEEIIFYNFDKQLQKAKFYMRGTKLFVDDKFYSDISIENDRLVMKTKVMSIEYVKLIPTETQLAKREIEGKTYWLQRDSEKVRIEFNVELEKTEILEITKRKRGRKIRLKKIDSTLFLSFTRNGFLDNVFPIKKVTHEFLEIYGFPKNPYTAIAQVIKQ